MSTFETAHRPGGTAAGLAAVPVLAGIGLRNVLAALGAALRSRSNARMLRHLSDRELKDIGLTRSDLGRLARNRHGVEAGILPKVRRAG